MPLPPREVGVVACFVTGMRSVLVEHSRFTKYNGSMSEFPITLTPEAVAHAKRLMARKGRESALLRVGVKGGGCSGYEYAVRFEDAARETDFVQEFDGLTVLVDPKSAELLRGATVAFSNDLLSGGFVFENPNASRSCGCGTSFTPKAAR